MSRRAGGWLRDGAFGLLALLFMLPLLWTALGSFRKASDLRMHRRYIDGITIALLAE